VKLKECFGCPVINRYDNEENGLIAITSPDSDIFRVNYQGLYIELLEDGSDRPVPPGVMGRVVITDLFNKAMPLIRYDTGDYAISDDETGHIRTLREICGRQAGSLIALNSNIVSSVSISVITEIFYNIEKYQIQQTDRTKFIFRYVGTINESEQTELMDRLKTSLGDAADINIMKVSEIKKGKNGKYNTIINDYKRNC
jgi:phenylacetate-CoA ligase